MYPKGVEWRLQFDNLTVAYEQFQTAVEKAGQLSDLEQEGLLQRFENTFELAWQTLKEYLEEHEVTATSPKDALPI